MLVLFSAALQIACDRLAAPGVAAAVDDCKALLFPACRCVLTAKSLSRIIQTQVLEPALPITHIVAVISRVHFLQPFISLATAAHRLRHTVWLSSSCGFQHDMLFTSHQAIALQFSKALGNGQHGQYRNCSSLKSELLKFGTITV
ncbi:uncharacterized [Tachysurus ichikawai]